MADKETLEDQMGAVLDEIKARDAGNDDGDGGTAGATTATTKSAEAATLDGSSHSSDPVSSASATDSTDTRERNPDGTYKVAPKDVKAAKSIQGNAKSSKAASPSAAKSQPGAQAQASPAGANASPAASAKDATAAQPKSDQASTTGADVNPPSWWSAAAKAAWNEIPAEKRTILGSALAMREKQISDGFARFQGIDQALAPMRQWLTLNGIAEPQYVNQLVAADLMLRNPQTQGHALQWIARNYGLNLGAQHQVSGDGSQQGASIPAQLSTDPTIATLQQQLSAVTQHLTSQHEAQRAAYALEAQEMQRQASADVETFRNDAANEFFDLVRDDIRAVYERAAVLNGKAPTLKDAYEQAIWANSQTRPILQARERQRLADDQANAAAQAAAQARKSAAPNVKGNLGASPAPRQKMEDEMAEIYDAIAAR